MINLQSFNKLFQSQSININLKCLMNLIHNQPFNSIAFSNDWRSPFDPMRQSFLRNALRINESSINWSLKGCCSKQVPYENGIVYKRVGVGVDDGFQKPHALAPYPQILRDADGSVFGNHNKIGNGDAVFERGGFSDRKVAQKLVVAVDVDEVLGNFVSALNKFIADRYSLNHSVSEYHVYEFFKIWNCSRDEADIRVHEFFKTSYFKTGIHPIPGARAALHKLSRFCDLSIVTSRQNAIKDHTIEWIEKHFPGLFREIHFGNHFAMEGKSRPKSDICRSLGAQVLVDDNPQYAMECAEVGMKVLLFDYENSYPWCKTDTMHPLVTKVHNWEQVEQKLASWTMS